MEDGLVHQLVRLLELSKDDVKVHELEMMLDVLLVFQLD
jgi:hypothetical protein